MSVILVVEQDRSYATHITDILQSGGWPARVVIDRAEAERSAAAAPPLLLIVDGTMAGAATFLAPFSRRRGGPGTVVLVPQALSERFDAAHYQADELLPKPFSDDDLKAIVDRCLRVETAPPAPTPATTPIDDSQQLTSEDIFADVLAEVEADARGRRPDKPAAKPPAAEPPTTPTPATEVPAAAAPDVTATAAPKPPPALDLSDLTAPLPKKPARRTHVRHDEDIERKLEETLSGVFPLGVVKARRKEPQATASQQAVTPQAATSQPATSQDKATTPAEAAPPGEAAPGMPDRNTTPPATEPVARRGASDTESDVEDLLDKTLGSLVMAKRPRPPSQAPVAATPPPTPAAPSQRDPTAELNALLSDDGTPSQPAAAPQEAVAAAAKAPPAATETPPIAAADTVLPAAAAGPPASEDTEAKDTASSEEVVPQAKPEKKYQTLTVPQLPAKEGETFGDYTLLERIAVGGMAEVWKARRSGVEGFQKTVAIKRILAHLGTAPDFVTMFIDEAKLAAQLNHNNIIQIYDLGKVGEDFFIAMEYVDGRDLRTILTAARRRGGTVPPDLATLIASLVARALDYAHRKRDFDDREMGLVHRDVSPQNVLISYEGEIKLCDFGIVKAVAKASTTQMGALKGKLQYMSPEQAWGKAVDGRSDIFSLGSVLYEVLTGNKLFAGDSEIGVLDAVRECNIPSPRAAVPTLGEDLERVVLKALAKAPEDRYQTAGELAQDLEVVLADLQPSGSQATLTTLANYMETLFHAPLPIEPPSGEPAEVASAVSTGTSTATGTAPGTASGTAAEPGTANDTQAALVVDAEEEEAPVRSNKGRWLLAVVLIILIVGAAIAWFLTQDRRAQPDRATPPTATGALTPAQPSPPQPPSPQPAPPQDTAVEPAAATDAVTPPVDPTTDLERMVEEEFARRAQQMREDFDSERQRLEDELAQARQDAQGPSEEIVAEETVAEETVADTPVPTAEDAVTDAPVDAGSTSSPQAVDTSPDTPPDGGNAVDIP